MKHPTSSQVWWVRQGQQPADWFWRQIKAEFDKLPPNVGNQWR